MNTEHEEKKGEAVILTEKDLCLTLICKIEELIDYLDYLLDFNEIEMSQTDIDYRDVKEDLEGILNELNLRDSRYLKDNNDPE